MEIEKQDSENIQKNNLQLIKQELQLLLNQNLLQFIDYFYNNGVCLRCIIRIANLKFNEPVYIEYSNLEYILQIIIEEYKNDSIIKKDYNEQNIINYQVKQECDKLDCKICLGILQQSDKKEFILDIKTFIDDQNFEYNTFKFKTLVPNVIRLRELHIIYLAQRHIQNQIKSTNTDQEQQNNEITQLNKLVEELKDNIYDIKVMLKNILTPNMETTLNKKWDKDGELEITLDFQNEQEDNDYLQRFKSLLASQRKFDQQNQKNNLRKQLKMNNKEALQAKRREQHNSYPQIKVEMTKQTIKEIYQLSSSYFLDTAFKNCEFQQTKFDTILHLNAVHDVLIIKGNYLKYVRNLPQTPFMGKTDSVSEVIAQVICPYFKTETKNTNFIGGGREDIDVRMLGKGRPFILEIFNPRNSQKYQNDETFLQEITEKIKESKVVEVNSLSFSNKDIYKEMHDSQEEKIKSYACYVQFENKLDSELLYKLNDINDMIIKQSTPIRVLHRRSPLIRDKMIHALKAYQIDDYNAIIYVLAGAGTYIKEFVHGDLERTLPNIGTLTNNKCDIFQLDVTGLYPESSEENKKDFYLQATNSIFE